LGWLTRDDFYEEVAKAQMEQRKGKTSMETWQNKIRRLRQFLRGWAKNKSGHYKNEKKQLLQS
jgi:hypothetical protein